DNGKFPSLVCQKGSKRFEEFTRHQTPVQRCAGSAQPKPGRKDEGRFLSQRMPLIMPGFSFKRWLKRMYASIYSGWTITRKTTWPRIVRLVCEQLEDRCCPSSFTVTSTIGVSPVEQ